MFHKTPPFISVFIFGLSFFCTTYGVSQEIKPNIIYIYADDLGYGHLGSYGQDKIKTPHLDRMAQEGMRFTQHYTGTPVCAPARCMLLTGRHGGHSFIRGNYEFGGRTDEDEGGQMPLPEGTVTIGHMLQQAGYTTGAIGKWGLGFVNSTGHPNRQGFDYFYGYLCQKQAHNYYPTHLWENSEWDSLANTYFSPHQKLEKAPETLKGYNKYKGSEYSPEPMTQKALEFLQENRDNPFFLYLPYTIPHKALQVPDNEAYKMYSGKWDSIPYLGEDGYVPNPQPNATYAAMITTLDTYVGQIMKKLKELGLDENTMVLFSSDNGPSSPGGGIDIDFFNSTGGLRGYKSFLYEGGIRMPFIARWPGQIAPGQVSDLISTQYDMMATFADLAGVTAPPNDGIPLAPMLIGNAGKQKQHQYLYFEFPQKGGQIAIRKGNWKGVRRNLRKDPNAPWEIYNLDKDVSESRDVAGQQSDLIRQFDQIVKEEHVQATIREWEFFK